MHKDIGILDKVIILWHTGWKIIRGGYRRFFLKRVRGLFLVGKHVQITHGKHIICGKSVKFEDYSEIHGLCSDGLNFGDYVTISRGGNDPTFLILWWRFWGWTYNRRAFFNRTLRLYRMFRKSNNR